MATATLKSARPPVLVTRRPVSRARARPALRPGFQACARCGEAFAPPPRQKRQRVSHTRTTRIESFLKVRCPHCRLFQDRREIYLAGLTARQVQVGSVLALVAIVAALSLVAP